MGNQIVQFLLSGFTAMFGYVSIVYCKNNSVIVVFVFTIVIVRTWGCHRCPDRTQHA